MADRRDDIDAWLSQHIEPLPPPPGTFELIQRRARRRKVRKLAITATSAAVLVAAAVTVPQVVSLPVLSPNPTPSVAAGQSTAVTPGASARRSGTPSLTVSAAAPVPPVPPDFQPTSVTFIGTRTGWVIGQAGAPGHCATQYCTSVARTNDAGRTWVGAPAPLTSQPDGAIGVSQIRFLDMADGWAFGPQLYVTHDGGQTWTQVDTHGLRVTSLETAGNRAFAVWASCTGTGLSFAASCTRFTLYSSPAAASDWTPVGAATTGLTNGGTNGAAALALTGTKGYLLGPAGALYAGPVDGSAAWRQAGSLPSACSVGTALPWGQPSGALFGAVNAGELIAACTSGGNPAAGTQEKQVFSSPDGGASWLQMGAAPAAGIAFSVAASPSESVVLATDKGIVLLPKGEVSWRMATLTAAGPAGGFGYVGMTTHEQGVALPGDPASGTVWFTFDGGQTWQPSRLNGS